jgi:hypothetical protein
VTGTESSAVNNFRAGHGQTGKADVFDGSYGWLAKVSRGVENVRIPRKGRLSTDSAHARSPVKNEPALRLQAISCAPQTNAARFCS